MKLKSPFQSSSVNP